MHLPHALLECMAPLLIISRNKRTRFCIVGHSWALALVQGRYFRNHFSCIWPVFALQASSKFVAASRFWWESLRKRRKKLKELDVPQSRWGLDRELSSFEDPSKCFAVMCRGQVLRIICLHFGFCLHFRNLWIMFGFTHIALLMRHPWVPS